MKRLVEYILIILLCVGCSSNKDNINTKDNLIASIISYDNNYDYNFLDYIYNNYGIDVLSDIDTSYKNNTYSYNIWHNLTGNSLKVLNDLFNNNYNSNNVKVLDSKDDITLNFIGDVSLADNFDIMPYYDSRKEGIYGILSKEVVDILTTSDITAANNEFTISTRGTPLNKTYTFRAAPNRLNIYKEMGVNLVSLANNHIYDYGIDAFNDTLDYLKEYDIPHVGAGKNIDEAKEAFYYIAGGYKISFISSTRAEKNIITPGATSDSPGVFRCYDNTLLKETIKEEKEKSDYVILLIHWGREDSHELEEVIKVSGREYIDEGADLIVGSHAHELQGMEIYNNKLIAYNLGDFIFNRETKDTGILSVTLNKNGNLSYKFIPCKQDNYKTSLLEGKEKDRVLNNMNSYSINVIFNNDGIIKTVN